MLQYSINEAGKLQMVVLLHDCDGTDIVAIDDDFFVVDEVNGEMVPE